MANDPHDNEAADRAMLRKLQDQEDAMHNDDERDYAEEQFNRHLLDDETDPEGERDTPRLDALLRENDMFRRYAGQGTEPATRSGHRTAAMHLAGMAERSDPEFGSGLGLAAVTHAVLALSADREPEREPDAIWLQRAVDAEAALTAIGGILVSENGIVRKAELISGVLREAGQQADRLMARDKPPASPAPLSGTDRDGIIMPGGWSVYYDGHLVFSTSTWESIAAGVESIMKDSPS